MAKLKLPRVIRTQEQYDAISEEYKKYSKSIDVRHFKLLKSRLDDYDSEAHAGAMQDKPMLSTEEVIINSRLDHSRYLLMVKGREYTRNSDRLHNFRRAAEMDRTTMPRALHGMLQKHLVSYYDMLDDIDKGIMPSEKFVDEKLGDIIVYFLLQEAVINETIKNQ